MECYDLVLLDLNLPKKDGMTVLRALRQTDRETRVLILSARSEVEDKVQGLSLIHIYGKAHQNRQHDCRHAGRLDDRIDANRNGAVTEQGRQIIFQVLR